MLTFDRYAKNVDSNIQARNNVIKLCHAPKLADDTKTTRLFPKNHHGMSRPKVTRILPVKELTTLLGSSVCVKMQPRAP